ncbi:threonine ammonia-lyase [Labrys monachus]|uniref:Threonine dehydratase n=1 Tax=Labrys monachus TaxID=217067 RepID=A0ABU0FJ65_9HYPH|nr:threonine/serine dehydratase [Labrys monachus]MDQ0394659.1 threonine dehydratase [Labrys monachus]
MTGAVCFEDIERAARRIHGHVRRTPCLRADQLSAPLCAGDLWLKLEYLQVTGSFKARGSTNKLLSLPAEALARGVVTASGGNHGLAVARAARLAGVPATVFLPENAAPSKIAKLRRWGAEVHVAGAFWDEAHVVALQEAERSGACYFHPFADREIVAGQGTVALEIIEDLGTVDVYLIAVGGGGLIAGMATAIRRKNPAARIIGIEPKGSPTLHDSLLAGRAVRLPAVTTRVATMACGQTDEAIVESLRDAVERIVLVEDEDLEAAARWLWFELGIAADLSGAASIAALMTGAVTIEPGARVCGIVCGAGLEGHATP